MKEVRSCGWDDEALFDYVDGALPASAARSFESHLEGCAACRSDVVSYGDLDRALDAMAPLEARPGFDNAVLAAVLGEHAVVEPAAAGRESRFANPVRRLAEIFATFPAPLQVAIGLASAIALFVITNLSRDAIRAGGWRELFGHAVSGVVTGFVNLVTGAAGQVLTAVKISDVFFNLARALEPVLRSVPVAVNAFGTEFWLFSTLLSLLALLGAVRLATGSAVERGIGRVHFIL